MNSILYSTVFNNRYINNLIFRYVREFGRGQTTYKWNQLIRLPHVLAGNRYYDHLKDVEMLEFLIYRFKIHMEKEKRTRSDYNNLFIENYMCINSVLRGAAQYGRFDMVRHLLATFKRPPTGWDYHSAMIKSALSDNLEQLKFFVEKCRGLELNLVNLQSANIPFKTLEAAAFTGSLQAIEYLMANRTEDLEKSQICRYATRGGHIHVIEYMIKKHRTKYEEEILKTDWDNLIGTCTIFDCAVKFNRYDILKLLHSNGMKECSTSVFVLAASCGNVAMLRWLQENTTCTCGSQATAYASANGHLEAVLFLVGNQVSQDYDSALQEAIKYGHLETAQWISENTTHPIQQHSLETAVSNGYLDIVKWINKSQGNESSLFENAIDWAAKHGRLEIIKWLHENRSDGCLPEAMDCAAAYGLEITQWFHFNRKEGCTSLAMDRAANTGQFDVVIFLHENRSEGCSKMAFEDAACNNHFEIVEWLVDNRTEGIDSPTLLEWSAFHGNLDLVKKIMECTQHRVKCSDTAIKYAIKSGRLDLIQYMIDPKVCNVNLTKYVYEHLFRYNYHQALSWILDFMVYSSESLNLVSQLQNDDRFTEKYPYSLECKEVLDQFISKTTQE
ncbi:hypothetical protein PPL_10965 [Heterostelium album PN500]|uniref:Ankyrin repeat-containing protein n=1 Tax=Heterostelium pallidum (strain ATCC 26659 / Pp 5 / PN500) TaxID=670386 RepID=D3BSJ6_HETP5|nr:hypothetical protein PPL_10965 [Heterostelium album PN500]EFA75461.1 hypothetical protein PPL_10965 [Heterostelium album PN500]|eukprot:XP_020427595.1 hypothetical protein PPL_10965 [Heterostelium album PN500]